jgi:hypothetical protein
LGGGAAGGLLVDEVFAASLWGVAADGGGGVVDVAVEDERECMRALVELGGGGKPAAAGVGEFGLGEDFDGVVAGEIDRQRGDEGAEFLGDVIEAAVGALEEIDQEVLLAVGGNKDVAKFNRRHDPHPLISDPCSPAPLLFCSPECRTDRGDETRGWVDWSVKKLGKRHGCARNDGVVSGE